MSKYTKIGHYSFYGQQGCFFLITITLEKSEEGFKVNENPFKKEMCEYISAKTTLEMTLPWKHEFDGFILYFFPNLKRKNYDIFYNVNRKKAWEHYLNVSEFLEGKKKKFKNCDLISE